MDQMTQTSVGTHPFKPLNHIKTSHHIIALFIQVLHMVNLVEKCIYIVSVIYTVPREYKSG